MVSEPNFETMSRAEFYSFFYRNQEREGGAIDQVFADSAFNKRLDVELGNLKAKLFEMPLSMEGQPPLTDELIQKIMEQLLKAKTPAADARLMKLLNNPRNERLFDELIEEKPELLTDSGDISPVRNETPNKLYLDLPKLADKEYTHP